MLPEFSLPTVMYGIGILLILQNLKSVRVLTTVVLCCDSNDGRKSLFA
jgi:hypothetical protein